MGINRFVFWKLLRVLEQKVGLGPTRFVSAEEQLAIFLCIAQTGLSNSEMQEHFQRSGDTISKYVLLLCGALLHIHQIVGVSIVSSTCLFRKSSTLIMSAYQQMRFPLKFRIIQSSSPSFLSATVHWTALSSMLLSQKLIWQGSTVGKDSFPPIYW